MASLTKTSKLEAVQKIICRMSSLDKDYDLVARERTNKHTHPSQELSKDPLSLDYALNEHIR